MGRPVGSNSRAIGITMLKIATVMSLFIGVAAQVTLSELLAQHEADVRRLVASALSVSPAGCNVTCGCHNAARGSNILTQSRCMSSYGGCSSASNCTAVGIRRLDLVRPTLQTAVPPTFSIRRDACWLNSVEGTFRSLAGVSTTPTSAQISALERNTKKWMYVSTPSSLMVTYPGFPTTTTTYDPRVRPWYVAATTGPKDVVLVLDVSGSMQSYGRMAVMKQAAVAVLGTLAVTDFVAVVKFSSSSRQLCNYAVGCGRLARATNSTVDALISLVNGLQASGATNFEAGLTTAMQLLVANSEYTANCHRAVLFLTDGHVTSGSSGSRLLQTVASANTRNAVIFTYSLGSGADATLPKQLACASAGMWAQVTDGGNLRSQMTHYYQYFANLHSSSSSGPKWVEEYVDGFGAGRMTTVSMPIYDNSTQPPLLLAVAGIDVLSSDMRTFEPDYQRFLTMLIGRSSSCPTIDRTQGRCTLARLRATQFNAAGQETYGNTAATCAGDTTIPNCPLTAGPRSCPQTTVLPSEMYCNYSNTYSAADLTVQSCTGCSDPCESSGERSSGSSGSGGDSMIIGIAVGVVVILCLVVAAVLYSRHSRTKEPAAPRDITSFENPAYTSSSNSPALAEPTYADVVPTSGWTEPKGDEYLQVYGTELDSTKTDDFE